MDRQDFNEPVSLAMQQPGRRRMKPVVEKEILHYDIFRALRFIDSDTIAETLDNPQFPEYLVKAVNGLFNSMAGHLKGRGGGIEEPTFRM